MVTTSANDRGSLVSREWVDEAIRRSRGRHQPLGRHAPARLPAAARVGDRPLPEGRVGAPHRVAEAPARPLAVPLRALQRLDHRGHDDRRGLQRLHGRLGGLLRPAARAAVRRGHAGLHQPGEDRADRVPGRRVPPGGRPARRSYDEARRLAAERGGHFLDQFTYAERAMDWRGNNNIAESIFGQMALERHPVPGLGGGRRRDRRDQRDHRPLRALSGGYATRLCVVDPEDSVFYPSWTRRPVGLHRPAVAHRGHRPAAGGAVVPAGGRRPDDPGPGRGVDRDDAARAASAPGAAWAARPARTCGARCSSSPRCSRAASAAASSP